MQNPVTTRPNSPGALAAGATEPRSKVVLPPPEDSIISSTPVQAAILLYGEILAVANVLGRWLLPAAVQDGIPRLKWVLTILAVGWASLGAIALLAHAARIPPLYTAIVSSVTWLVVLGLFLAILNFRPNQYNDHRVDSGAFFLVATVPIYWIADTLTLSAAIGSGDSVLRLAEKLILVFGAAVGAKLLASPC
jgi:hypothetical protein